MKQTPKEDENDENHNLASSHTVSIPIPTLESDEPERRPINKQTKGLLARLVAYPNSRENASL